jgi:hypothetical protein
VTRYFHVSSSRNRESIRAHGLNPSLMHAARGIAGSTSPEVEGIFLGVDEDVDWFVRMNNTGGTVDVWAVDGIESKVLVPNGSGYFYFPGSVPADKVTLLAADLPSVDQVRDGTGSGGAYVSNLSMDLGDAVVD